MKMRLLDDFRRRRNSACSCAVINSAYITADELNVSSESLTSQSVLPAEDVIILPIGNLSSLLIFPY